MAKILIIEDEDDLRNAIRRTLELNEYDVVTVRDGRRAIAEIKNNPPDLVLTDIFMPGMEGLETIRILATDYPDLPIVVMTGSLDRLFIDLSLKFGAVHGLNKPFSTDELLIVIEKYMHSDAEVGDAVKSGITPENKD